MTRERAHEILRGASASIRENGPVVLPPDVLEELAAAGFVSFGYVQFDALREFAGGGDGLTSGEPPDGPTWGTFLGVAVEDLQAGDPVDLGRDGKLRRSRPPEGGR